MCEILSARLNGMYLYHLFQYLVYLRTYFAVYQPFTGFGQKGKCKPYFQRNLLGLFSKFYMNQWLNVIYFWCIRMQFDMKVCQPTVIYEQVCVPESFDENQCRVLLILHELSKYVLSCREIENLFPYSNKWAWFLQAKIMEYQLLSTVPHV